MLIVKLIEDQSPNLLHIKQGNYQMLNEITSSIPLVHVHIANLNEPS